MILSPQTTKIIIAFISKHWWKVCLILLAAGIAASGFSCPTPWGVIEKTKVYQKSLGGSE